MPTTASSVAGKTPYFNRELSWLAFNRRVLEQAQDARFPILERLRYVAFTASNLDEFFEIRVAGLMQQLDGGITEPGIDSLGPKEQLRRIHSITAALVSDLYRVWDKEIRPGLRKEGITFKSRAELNKAEQKWCAQYFEEQVFPVLTPMAIDPSHPFPQIGNKTLNLLLWLDDPLTPNVDSILAIVPVPRILPRVVRVGGKIGGSSESLGNCEKMTLVFMGEIIKMYAHRLFPGYNIRSINAFRITRNSDLYIDEEETQNLLRTIEEELYKMRRGAAVRLEIEAGLSDPLLARLLEAIRLTPENVFHIHGPINLMRMLGVYDMIDRPELKFPAYTPVVPSGLGERSALFDRIAEADVLLHHPYESFQPVIDLLQQAAVDEHVLAIKLTLYRTSSDSPIVKALTVAARNGKQVTALIELKARFDEAQNIQWAKVLEEAGVHVVYGLVGLKTHCKCTLVVRRESGGLRRYAHLGTGNYNPKTARLYSDLSLLTANPQITNEVAELFNALTGFSRQVQFQKLLVAPFNLHSRIQELIRQEAENARQGRPARIIAKCNSLVEKETIDNLYAASQAGVKIDLIVRGICCLVPGLPGLSENIRVRSILGRYLEHSRIYYFENSGGQPVMLSGSADWMQRNFFRRIEVTFPVEAPALRRRLLDEVLGATLRDNTQAKFLQANGAYQLQPRAANEEAFCAQDYFAALAETNRQLVEDDED